MLRTRSPVTPELPPKCPRLACVKHAASVRPEPGSNSPIISLNLAHQNTVTLFYDSVSESRNCSDLNSPPHPERRRINEFASHNLTLRSQLSNSGSTLFLSPANSYSGESLIRRAPPATHRATDHAPTGNFPPFSRAKTAGQSPLVAITAAYSATATQANGH